MTTKQQRLEKLEKEYTELKQLLREKEIANDSFYLSKESSQLNAKLIALDHEIEKLRRE